MGQAISSRCVILKPGYLRQVMRSHRIKKVHSLGSLGQAWVVHVTFILNQTHESSKNV